MNTTLVIMAAGIGSRFGGGIKQLEAVGPSGEIIMDYSIHDALEAGFNKIVFIIRKDLEKDFKEIIGNRIEKICNVAYAFQEIDNLSGGFAKPESRKKLEGRTKPWGTGQAVLSCKGIVNEPFAVINADDYYGKEAFVKVHDYLVKISESKSDQVEYCMAGFILRNTLSDNGGVTRGVCRIDKEHYLTKVVETRNIIKTHGDVGFPDGAAVLRENGKTKVLDADYYVSMNMWGLMPGFMDTLETGFVEFLSSLEPGDIKSEYLLPTIMDGLIQSGEAKVKLLESNDLWLGLTYKEDKAGVVEAIKKLVAKGVYKEKVRV